MYVTNPLSFTSHVLPFRCIFCITYSPNIRLQRDGIVPVPNTTCIYVMSYTPNLHTSHMRDFKVNAPMRDFLSEQISHMRNF